MHPLPIYAGMSPSICLERALHRLSAMPAISATTVFAAAARPSQALGLPRLRVAKATRLRCRCSYSKDLRRKASQALALAVVKGAPLLVEASAMMAATGPVLATVLVLALVDEQIMPTEGAGMNNDQLLGWILVVALGLALSYTVYSSILDDDQSSAGGITI